MNKATIEELVEHFRIFEALNEPTDEEAIFGAHFIDNYQVPAMALLFGYRAAEAKLLPVIEKLESEVMPNTSAREAELEALIIEMDKKLPHDCVWKQDWDGNWHAGCGLFFVLNDGTPDENNMHYCPKCGGELVAEPYEVEVEDEQ